MTSQSVNNSVLTSGRSVIPVRTLKKCFHFVVVPVVSMERLSECSTRQLRHYRR